MLAGAPSDMVPGGDSSERRRCDGRLRRLERVTSGVAGAISSAMVLSIARSIARSTVRLAIACSWRYAVEPYQLYCLRPSAIGTGTSHFSLLALPVSDGGGEKTPALPVCDDARLSSAAGDTSVVAPVSALALTLALSRWTAMDARTTGLCKQAPSGLLSMGVQAE